jgi:ComF family protein
VASNAVEPPPDCSRCRQADRPVVSARAIGPYEGRLRDIIHAFKYDKRRTLGRPLGALLRETGWPLLDGADAVVPVPLHRSRRHQRGFNQAEALAERLGVRVVRALRRRRRTRPQVELPAEERHRNVAGAFSLAWRYRRPWRRSGGGNRPRPLEGWTIVLVDDVSTTGATLEACARVLLAAGAREVRALTLARVE